MTDEQRPGGREHDAAVAAEVRAVRAEYAGEEAEMAEAEATTATADGEP